MPTTVLRVILLGLFSLSAATPALARDPDPAVESTLWLESPESRAWLPPADGPAAGPLDPALCVGWPVNLHSPGAGFPYTPTLFDGDGDGADEIFLTGGHTFGLRGDGTFLPGWPTTEQPYMGYGTNDQKPGPSVADLERDGDTEILWSERDWYAGSARMWSFNGKEFDATNLPGFPQEAIGGSSNALDVPFVLGDTDDDGDLEAWGPHTLGNNFVHYRISAFDHLGTRLFTTDLNPAENALSLYFGDLDGNNAQEMFAISFLSPSLYLHAFTATGAELPGYPLTLHTFAGGNLPFGPPVPADLDGDGDLEILVGHWDGSGSRVFAHHHDGSSVAGFPLAIATSSQLFYFCLGDLTGDRRPELIAFDNHLAGAYRVHVLDLASGSALAGWPYTVAAWPKGFPTVVDVDNDGYQDVCVADAAGELRAIDRTGQLIAGYPRVMSSASISGVAAGDIDGDDLFELVAATWDGWVYAWDTSGEARPERADWPLRNVNARNTGVYGTSGSTSGLAAAPPASGWHLQVAPNPVLGRAEFQWRGARSPVVLEIIDSTGRIVDRLGPVAGPSAVWQPPSTAAAGVYFARPADRQEPGIKLVLMR